MEGPNLFIFVVLSILLTCYSLQAFLAILNAARRKNGDPSVISRLFGGLSEVTGTWATVGIILILPVLISWASGVSDALLDLEAGLALYSACTSTLLVLITLEFSQLNNLNDRNRDDWRGLLLFALALDLISILILVWPIKSRVHQGDQPDWSGVMSYMIAIGVAALISSFLVILFSRKAGEQ